MSDEHFYHEAANEIKDGVMDTALSAKAFAKAEGDERRIHATYIELRVAQLKTEAARESARQMALGAKAAAGKAGNAIVAIIKWVLTFVGIGFAIYILGWFADNFSSDGLTRAEKAKSIRSEKSRGAEVRQTEIKSAPPAPTPRRSKCFSVKAREGRRRAGGMESC